MSYDFSYRSIPKLRLRCLIGIFQWLILDFSLLVFLSAILVFLQSISLWSCALLIESEWSRLEKLLVTSMSMSLAIDSGVFFGWHLIGRCGWGWRTTNIWSSPTLLILQSMSLLHHPLSCNLVLQTSRSSSFSHFPHPLVLLIFWFVLNIDGSFDTGNAGSSCWPSFAPFVVIVYLPDYARSLDTRHFQAMPALGDSRTVYNAWHGANRNTQVRVWIKRCAH